MTSDTRPVSQFFLPISSSEHIEKGTMIPCNTGTNNINNEMENTSTKDKHDDLRYKENYVDLSKYGCTNNDTHKERRSVKRPEYLKDYLCNHTNTHWCKLVKFQALTATHKEISYTISTYDEPNNYKEASQNPLWVEAMKKELEALSKNKTWVVVTLPKGKKAIGCKWVYKVKLKSDGTLERFKARLVAKGYNQKYGIDYDETFSPVVKMTTIRCVLAIAASQKWIVYQLDVNNAFLHGNLNEEVYIHMLERVENPKGKVCLLKKSLYGLKQASRQWHNKLLEELKSLGYVQSKNDYSLFTKRTSHFIVIVTVYVDDILITGSNQAELKC